LHLLSIISTVGMFLFTLSPTMTRFGKGGEGVSFKDLPNCLPGSIKASECALGALTGTKNLFPVPTSATLMADSIRQAEADFRLALPVPA
jgi:hypothetical protein